MKKKSTASKVIAAVKSAIAPEHVTVRYSVNHETWVKVDPKDLDNVIEALPVPCYLTDVTFSVHDIHSRSRSGCGSSYEGKAGVAAGTLRTSLPRGVPKTGYDNLGFNETGFTSGGQPLTTARVLFLENERFAKVLV